MRLKLALMTVILSAGMWSLPADSQDRRFVTPPNQIVAIRAGRLFRDDFGHAEKRGGLEPLDGAHDDRAFREAGAGFAHDVAQPVRRHREHDVPYAVECRRQ